MNIEPKKVFISVSVQDELPDHNKHVFAFCCKTPVTAYYTQKNETEADFEDEDFDPDFVDKGFLKEGWYEDCENVGHYDVVTHQRKVDTWLKEQNLYCFTKEELIELLNDYEQKLCVIPMSGEEYIEQLNIK
jgi:hypothetical protein